MVNCGICEVLIADNLLNWHLGTVHKYDPDFRISCAIEGCNKSYTKWSSYRQHMWRGHNTRVDDTVRIDNQENEEVMEINNPPGEMNAGQEPPAPPTDPLSTTAKLQFQCALFVARLREKYLIPQSTLDKVIEGTTLLLEDFLNIVQDTVLGDIQDPENVPVNAGGEDIGVPANIGDDEATENEPANAVNDAARNVLVNTIKEAFRNAEPTRIFECCNSPHNMTTFMTKSLGLVKASKIKIGEREVWTKAGTLKKLPTYAYIVPFLESLQQCLNNEDILKCVENPLPLTEGFLKSVTDGIYYRTHPVFQFDSKALSFMIYYDDVEYTNPLGSKVHKVAMFYWVLNNIYPEFRSTFRVHNLLAVVMTKDLKEFGTDIILENFVSAMNQLGQEQGVVLKIRGVDKVFHGFLNIVAGDTPASGYLGGFKEGVGGALHPCRRCNISKTDMKLNFEAISFDLRTLDEHNRQLEVLSTAGLTDRSRTFWSKQFGVNSRSPLLNINNFDVTQCLPHDFMHTVLEGVLPCHMLYFIKYLINKGKFDLDSFNAAMVGFDYKSLIKNKPSKVEASHLENGLHQSAAQMLCLGQTLPFLIGRWLDEDVTDHLNSFILLMQIINIALAFEIHEDDADLLNLMIRIHHIRFKSLYGSDGITPKWHYFLYLSEQILLFGPPRQHWCMRCEALHSFFKNVSSRNKNFRNLCYTFATRKQKLQCIELGNVPGIPPKKFLDQDTPISGVKKIFRDYAYQLVLNICLPDLLPDSLLLLAKKLEVRGTCFKKESVILLNIPEEGWPSFGTVVEIVVWQTFKVIIYDALQTVAYEPKLNAYKVKDRELKGALLVQNLIFNHSLPKFTYGSADYVLLTYHRHTEFFG